MKLLEVLLIVGALVGFVSTFYCQIKAGNSISRKKVEQHKDPQRALNKPMPPKAILKDEGLKYRRGYYIGISLFSVCMFGIIVILALNSYFK